MRFRFRHSVVVPALGMVLVAGLGSMGIGVGPAFATAGVSAKTITLGLISPETGTAAPEYTGIVPSAKARIAYQNAHGGVDGRKIKLIIKDDATNPSTNQSATAALISEGVFGIIDESPVAFGGYKIAQQAGIPVTGGAYDGPEWWEKPNTNMFSISGQADPKDPQYDGLAKFAKAHGGTACGSVGYSISPSSTASASGFNFSCQAVGMRKAYLNNTLPFGSVAVTPLALSIKAAGVNTMWLPLDENTNFAIMTALKQAGVNLKVTLNATGYGQSLITDTAAVPDAQGAWFLATGAPVELHTKATEAFQAALARYAHYTGVPDFSWYEGWGGADLMIYGLKLAGKNPTQSKFINALHKVTNYTMGGLEPNKANFELSVWGKAPKTLCEWLVQFKGDSFVHPTEVCGKLLPGSDQLPSA